MAEANQDNILFSDNSQENSRKLFVGGLSWETTSDNLRAYMSRYGEVVDCSVKVDAATGRSRGFGFVMFKTVDEADMVLKTRPHMLDGKIIDPKKAVGISKTGLPVTKKIFVGGVRSETSDDALREYFSQFGTVHSLDFPIDHTTSKRRGFCFLEFDEPEAAEKAMSANFHPIGNQTVEVKPAYTKEQQQALQARGLWPPQSGSKPNQAFGIGQILNPGATADGTVPTTNGQVNQMAAVALFYQTYLQYALAFNAAAMAQNSGADGSDEIKAEQSKVEMSSNSAEEKPRERGTRDRSTRKSRSRSPRRPREERRPVERSSRRRRSRSDSRGRRRYRSPPNDEYRRRR